MNKGSVLVLLVVPAAYYRSESVYFRELSNFNALLTSEQEFIAL